MDSKTINNALIKTDDEKFFNMGTKGFHKEDWDTNMRI